ALTNRETVTLRREAKLRIFRPASAIDRQGNRRRTALALQVIDLQPIVVSASLEFHVGQRFRQRRMGDLPAIQLDRPRPVHLRIRIESANSYAQISQA